MSEPNEEEQASGPSGIAIVGLAARFPGAADAASFWANLRAGVESIAVLTDDELLAAGVSPAELADPAYVRAKGALDGADRFDAAFFGLTPREAEVMDPQHRVFLECAWEALEDAACDPERFQAGGERRIGVWAGSGTNGYLIANLLPDPARLENLGALQVLLLNDRDFLATRTCFTLDLKGPGIAVQSACSTSLVAVHMACQSLLGGECDVALAGGVSIGLPLRAGYLYQEGSVMSPDGHCRPFDAAAAGSVEGNGCGVVALKRLADAVADGDRIYAVLRGSAVNNDGAAKVGFTAPSVEGQAEAISESLLMADVPPESIGYVEAHGSGTPLGDPVEMAALTQAFRTAGARGTGFCAVGSVKSNIGHCNTAAGAAGLIKAALALAHREIPPSLHFTNPNPQIDFASSPFYVPTRALPWPAGEEPRRAGVSSFGLGGTNVHAVLEEAPPASPSASPSRPAQLLVVSARTPAALQTAAERLAERLETAPAGDEDRAVLADTAWTLQTGRKAFEHRRAVVARGAADAAAALRDPTRGFVGRRGGAGARPVVFLFPGLGDQYPGMARELYASEPVFRAEVDRCAAILAPLLGSDLRAVIFPPTVAGAPPTAPAAGADLRALLRRDAGPGNGAAEEAAALRRTLFAQPACFVVEYALGRLLNSWGIAPQALAGYSVGEYAAACLAGSLTLEQALALVARRSRLIEELPAGEMLAIPLPESEVRPLLGDGLSLAATNGPHFSVAGGGAEAIAGLERRLAADGVACMRLRTTHAFHSAPMEPAMAPLDAAARELLGAGMRPPKIPWISNVTGTWITAADLADPTYWSRHMRGTVRFAEALSELLTEPDRVFLEVGPGATLGTLVQQHPGAATPGAGGGRVAVATMRRAEDGGSDIETLLAAVGRLWIAGVGVDWARFHGGERRRRAALPTYPFERQRYWVEPPRGSAGTTSGAVVPAAGIGASSAPSTDVADWLWAPVWKRAPLSSNGEPHGHAGERWLVILDAEPESGSAVGPRLVTALRERGLEAVAVAPGAGLDEALREPHARILHLGGLTRDEPDFLVAQDAGLNRLLLLAQAVGGAGGSAPILLTVVANGLVEVLDGDPVYPAKATALGALKVLPQEVPRLTVDAVDVLLPAAGPDAAWISRLADLLLAAGEGSPVVAWRGRHRFERVFEPLRLSTASGTAPALAAGAAYLIADAGHGPGMAIADHLVRRVDARVALLLPADFPGRELWAAWPPPPDGSPEQAAVGAAVRRLRTLEAEVGLENVLIVRGDPGDEASVRGALAAARDRFGAVRGAFWTGGAFAGGLLQLKTPDVLHHALAPVARGAEALLAAVDSPAGSGMSFVVLSSTTPAVTGGLGQLDVAAAGAFLEALAARRSYAGGVPTVAVHWDPYQWGGWLVAGVAGGMADGLGVTAEDVEANLTAHGVTEERSGAALERLLRQATGTAIVSARDLGELIAETDSVTADTLLAQLGGGGSGSKAERPSLATAYEPPGDELEEQLAGLWQDLFGIAPIGRDDSFLELGGHSLLAIQIVTQIKRLLEVDLPVTALFEAPTVAQLARSVRRARGEADPEQMEALLALIEGLSPEEAMAKLAELEAASAV